MNIIIAIVFLIAVDIVSDIPQGQSEIDNIHRRLNRIERKLNIENIDVEMSGDIDELNERISEWKTHRNLPIYRNHDHFTNKRMRMNMETAQCDSINVKYIQIKDGESNATEK